MKGKMHSIVSDYNSILVWQWLKIGIGRENVQDFWLRNWSRTRKMMKYYFFMNDTISIIFHHVCANENVPKQLFNKRKIAYEK